MIDLKEEVSNLIGTDFNQRNIERINEILDKKYSGCFMQNSIQNLIIENLEDFTTVPALRLLEIANASASLTQKIINKYLANTRKIIATIIVDTDDKKIICEELLQNLYGAASNVEINVICGDFLSLDLDKFDIIVGTPQIKKVSGQSKKDLSSQYLDFDCNNTCGFSAIKALTLSKKCISITLPKYVLHNTEFKELRNNLNQFNIKSIVDFGEVAFKDLGIEFINLTINNKEKPNSTMIYSIALGKTFIKDQSAYTNPKFPNWLLYADNDFYDLAESLELGIFDVVRDRQITNSLLKSQGDIQILRAKNIPRDAAAIILTDEDKFITSEEANKLHISKFIDCSNIYLCPNMTTYPRLIKKPKGVLASGSLAFFIPKEGIQLTEEDVRFFASKQFEDFYRIARNHATRSLNLDKVAVYFFGKKQKRTQALYLEINEQ